MADEKKVRIHLLYPRKLWIGNENKHHDKGHHLVPESALEHHYAQTLMKEGTLSLVSSEAKEAADKGAVEAHKKLKADHEKLAAEHKQLKDDHGKLKEAHDKLKEELKAANELLAEGSESSKKKDKKPA